MPKLVSASLFVGNYLKLHSKLLLVAYEELVLRFVVAFNTKIISAGVW